VRAPGNIAAVDIAAPFSLAATAISPSRFGIGLLGSMMTLPFNCAPTSLAMAGSAE
jgi:hypothetical protein